MLATEAVQVATGAPLARHLSLETPLTIWLDRRCALPAEPGPGWGVSLLRVSGGVFLHRDGELVRMSEQLYATEGHLQELLAKHPELLSADGEPHRWLLIAREFGIADREKSADRWSVDHLFVDEEGVPTLVEVKRSTDTRIRREVVGQMLDYAANGVTYWNAETIRARFESGCGDEDPDERLASALGPEIEPTDYWKRVETNLAAGRLRLMFVSDLIPRELRAIVEFLNQHMPQVDVLALELKQYVDEDAEHQTLVPRLIGETEAARRVKAPWRLTTWDRGSWLAAYLDAREGDQAEVLIVERLFAWVDGHQPALALSFGGARRAGARVGLAGGPGLFAVYPGYAAGFVEIPFARLAVTPPFDSLELRRELQGRLNKILRTAVKDDRLEKYPSFPISTLANPESFESFVAAIDWVIAAALAATGDPS